MMRNAALVLVSILIGLVLLEAGTRAIDGVPIFTAENLIAQRISLLKTNSMAVYDPLLGWGLPSNQKHGGGNATFTTGEHGLRMNKAEISLPAKGAVLAVGDSFTAGSEVTDSESWPAQLEGLLGSPVLNAAVGGWGSDQIVLRAQALIPLLEPKTVVVSFMVDDIPRAKYRVFGAANKPYFLIRDGALVHMNNPVPIYEGGRDDVGLRRAVVGRSQIAVRLIERFGDWKSWLNSQSYVTADTDDTLVSCLLLRRLRQATATRGIRLIFLLQYWSAQIMTWTAEPDFARKVFDCATAAGIETVNSWDALKAVQRERGRDGVSALTVMHGDAFGHMSAAGNALIARLVQQQVEAGAAR